MPAKTAPASAPKKIEDIQTGRTDLFHVSHRDAEPAVELLDGKTTRRLNIREDFTDIFDFAESLRDGIRTPLRGYMGTNGKFQITDGERRWRGVKILAQRNHEVLLPVVREPRNYSAADRALDVLRTNNGKPLSMLEQAHGIQRAIEAGAVEKDIHLRLGCSPTHVVNCLKLLQTAPEVQQAVADGKMSGTLAADLQQAEPDKGKQKEIVMQATTTAADKGKDKITAKDLPIETGKKAAAAKKAATAPATPLAPPPPLASNGSGGTPVIGANVQIPTTGGNKATPTSDSRPQTSSSSEHPILAKLRDLQAALPVRKDCEAERYETMEYLIHYVEGKETLKTVTKFLLGII